MKAMDVDGMAMFMFAFAVAFAMRLIFWPPAPPWLRALVRFLISIVLALEIPLAVLGVALSWQLPSTLRDVILPIYFSIFAALCQISSAIWLTRYRKEGL